MTTTFLRSALLAATLAVVNAFYLPGVAPTSYAFGEQVPITVNALTPTVAQHDSQLHAVVSYDYYHPEFHFCEPEGGPTWVRESLGSILFGDRIQTSPFEIFMGKDEKCKAVCIGREFDGESATFVNDRIAQAYNVNLLIDSLPAAELVEDPTTGEKYGTPGFLLGSVIETGPEAPLQILLHNHWDFIIEYHKAGITSGNKYRVVGVLVEPRSFGNSQYIGAGSAECYEDSGSMILNEKGGTKVQYTYSVHWKESKTAWATRWDNLLHSSDPMIHWFYLVVSTAFVVLLLASVSTILTRTLRKDIARYNRLDDINLDDFSGNSPTDDDLQEDSGWKLVHGDVFRAPKYVLLLSILLGSGAQLFVMTGTTLAFALLGFLSPSNRGFLMTVSLLLYTITGCVGGYVSARCYKTYGGDNWKLNIALTPALVPGVVFSSFFLFNLFVWSKGSSGAVPVSTLLAIIGIWFFISVPSSVIGSWFGFKQAVPEPPTKTNQIPRQIPLSPTSLRPLPSLLMTGVLPFFAIAVELMPIFTSLWTSKFYYMFGFLFICYGIMVLTAACATILFVYFMLCAEDYRWQWRAFLGAGMTGVYVFAVALWYWLANISFGGVTGAVLYVGYSALIGALIFVLCGSIGFISSYWFVYRIYGSIKVD